MASASALRAPSAPPPLPGQLASTAPRAARANPFTPWTERLQIVTRHQAAPPTLPTSPGERVVQGTDSVELLFQIEGTGRLVRQGRRDVEVFPGDGLVAFHGAAACARWLEEGSPFRQVSILCDPELLRGMLPDDSRVQPALHARFVRGDAIAIRHDRAICRVAERLMGYAGDQLWPDLLVQANAVELLCAGIRALLEPAPTQDGARLLLSDRDIDALNAARRHIVDHLAAAPTIQQVARMVGLNQQKLKVGFRECFGETIYAFTLAQRMDLAWRLLDQDQQPIKMVAARVGYRCAASFARAFERHWGILPSAVRRGAGQGAMA